MCCSRLAENTGRKKVTKNRHLGTIAQLRRTISSQLRHVWTVEKNVLSSNTSSTCLYNIVNFGSLAAEIFSLVWGTPGNFNGFSVGNVTARHCSSGRQPNFAALNRGRHLYLAGRPSRWALAHISSFLSNSRRFLSWCIGWHKKTVGDCESCVDILLPVVSPNAEPIFKMLSPSLRFNSKLRL